MAGKDDRIVGVEIEDVIPYLVEVNVKLEMSIATCTQHFPQINKMADVRSVGDNPLTGIQVMRTVMLKRGSDGVGDGQK
jgi:hypothetical protein